MLAEVARYVELGYRAVRVQAGVPGLATTYGVSEGPAALRAGRRAPMPTEAALVDTARTWPTSRRSSPGSAPSSAPDLKLLHDVHHRLTPIEAARLGKSLEPYALTWLEDPVPAELQEGFRLIRQHTTTPIAVGEVFNTDLGLPSS